MVNATTFICGTAIIIIIAYDFGFTYPKQVTITPENIEITNIFSKRNINISEINKIWEGYQSSFKSSFKCIFIEYKNGSKDRIRSCYLDEKSKQMLLSIR